MSTYTVFRRALYPQVRTKDRIYPSGEFINTKLGQEIADEAERNMWPDDGPTDRAYYLAKAMQGRGFHFEKDEFVLR